MCEDLPCLGVASRSPVGLNTVQWAGKEIPSNVVTKDILTIGRHLYLEVDEMEAAPGGPISQSENSKS